MEVFDMGFIAGGTRLGTEISSNLTAFYPQMILGVKAVRI